MRTVFEKARKFVCRNARPLDYARWKYHFEGGSADEIVRLLEAYQNPDGGFGHALEQDSLCPLSTPIQTWCATTILREIGLFDPAHPMVAGILRYLTSGHAFNGHTWSYTIPEGNEYPHAPWWHHSDHFEPEEVYYNPAASLAGYMLRSAPHGSEAYNLGERVAREAFEFYMQASPEQDMHILACYLTLYRDINAIAPALFNLSAMKSRLMNDISSNLRFNAGKWEGNYCALPSDFILSRTDPLYECFADLAEQECDFIVNTQQSDGAWPVVWSWSDYPEAFAVSASFWRGSFCIKNMLYLKGMGKL